MARPSLREKLASSAVETLHASGFHGCSIQDITEAAGVPFGTISSTASSPSGGENARVLQGSLRLVF